MKVKTKILDVNNSRLPRNGGPRKKLAKLLAQG
jgi:hypothetical protein